MPCEYLFAPNSLIFRKNWGEEEEEEGEQEVDDDLGICVLNLQIPQEKIEITRPRDWNFKSGSFSQ